MLGWSQLLPKAVMFQAYHGQVPNEEQTCVPRTKNIASEDIACTVECH